MSLERFHRYAPRTTVVDGKSTTKLPKQPWRAKKSEIRFVDEVLPRYVRLPNSIKNGKIASYFTDTLTFADAVMFFSGFGKIILSLLPSIGAAQREALSELIDGCHRRGFPSGCA